MTAIARPQLGGGEYERLLEVMESGMLADGPEVRAFEQEFAEYCGTAHGVATSNGTTALHTALNAIGIGDGDRVLTTPFSFVASANAIRLCGAEPVFGDIDPGTFNLDPEAAEAVLGEQQIDAMLVVHLYGLPADMEPLLDLATDHDIPLVEDAAQAHGAEYNGKRVGGLGDVGCFSFYPTKNMTTGEGGMVVTDRESVAKRAARFVNHGRASDGGYEHVSVGHNFRMTSLAAAVGRIQLERLPAFIDARRDIAAELTGGLTESSVRPPIEPAGRKHVYHQYTIRSEDREGLREHLAAHDIESGIYYPACIHEQPAYDGVSHVAPNAERAAEEVLSLPVHPGVSDDEVTEIIEVIRTYDQ